MASATWSNPPACFRPANSSTGSAPPSTARMRFTSLWPKRPPESALAGGIAGLERTVGDLDQMVGERLGAASQQLKAVRAELLAAGQEQVHRQQALDAALGRLATAQPLRTCARAWSAGSASRRRPSRPRAR